MPSNPIPMVSPDLSIVLQLHPAWGPVGEDGSDLGAALTADLTVRLAELLAVLGIPGRPAVRIAPLGASEPDEEVGMTLAVNGETCALPWPILDRVYSFVAGTHEPAPRRPSETAQRLVRIARGPRGGDPLVEYLATGCVAAITEHPDLLLGLPQATGYIASLPAPAAASTPPIPDGAAVSQSVGDGVASGIAHDGTAAAVGSLPAAAAANNASAVTLPSFGPPSGARLFWPPEPTWLLPILRNVLAMGISIAGKQTMADALRSALAEPSSAADITEDLIAKLRPDFIEIRMSPVTLRQITTDNVAEGPALFPFVRKGLHSQLGVPYPAFRFAPAEDLPPNCFAVTVNHLVTLPWLGLAPNQSLVQAAPETLAQLLLVPAARARHPGADGIHPPAYSTVSATGGAIAAKAGLVTWDQLGYLGQCLAITLREHGACFIDSTVVDQMLKQVEQVFPALVKASLYRHSVQEVTGLVRALVAHRRPVRNLPLILERLLDYDLQRPTGHDRESLIAFIEDGLPTRLRNRMATPITEEPWWPLFIEQKYTFDRA